MAKLTPFTDANIVKSKDDEKPKDQGLLIGRARAQDRKSVRGLLSVIGEDNRERVVRTHVAPWRMICSLRLRTRAGGAFIGTGWFVGPRTVITAGHCIHDRNVGPFDNIEVIPGRDGMSAPFGRITVPRSRMEVHPRWGNGGFDPDRDVGVLHLHEPKGEETGWFAATVAEDGDLEGHLVNVAGYPATSPEGATSGDELWRHGDAIARLEGERLYYATDTTGGQSGGPVWCYADQGGAPIVVGVHAYGKKLLVPGGRYANSAPRIDEDLGGRIVDWIERSRVLADDAAGARVGAIDLSPPPPPAPPMVPPSGSGGGGGEPPDEKTLMKWLADPDVPMERIRPWLQSAPSSAPFSPRVRPSPEVRTDGPRPEGGFFLERLNGWMRAKRGRSYERAARRWPDRPRLVMDGDSWFMHPLITDTWDHLSRSHPVLSLDGAGDLLTDISAERAAIDAVSRTGARAVLLSGGGNDLLKGGSLREILLRGSGDDPKDYLDLGFFERKLEVVIDSYRDYIRRIVEAHPSIDIFLHGYDLPVPREGGSWLGGPMRRIVPPHVQTGVAALMMNRFNDAQIDLAVELGQQVRHMDMRGVAAHPWFDEIHPSDSGYGAVAARFDAALRETLQPAGPRQEFAGGGAVLPPLAPHLDRLPGGESGERGDEVRAQRRFASRMLDAGKMLIPATAAPELAEISGNVRILKSVIPPSLASAFADDPAVVAEVLIGEPDFLPARFLLDGAERARAVCRVVLRGGGSGTGSLLRGGYIMTNNHVLSGKDTARRAIAEFGFEEGGTLTPVKLDPDKFFLTSTGHDLTIVACDTGTIADVPPLTIPLAPSGIVKNTRVNIVQHPDGRAKEVAFRDNKIVEVFSGTFRYRTDTEPGSSGSPVFDDSWQLVGLHRAGETDVSNQAVRIDLIAGFLESQLRAGGQQAAPEVLGFLTGTAPELGFFGRAGIIDELRPEVELPTFTGDGEFADIGFWNIKDFFDRDISENRIEAVADLLISMNMDAMGLSEVSRGNIERVVEAMNRRGENADFVFLDTQSEARDLALLYDRDTTAVEMLDDVSDRHEGGISELIDGKRVFPRRPLIARVTIGDATFAMIVVHLKSKAGRNKPLSERRRRRAAEVLRLIAEDIRETLDIPVIIGGDYNEDLNTDVLAALTDAPDFLTLTANDQENGALTYVSGRFRSLIDHVIVAGDARIGDIAGDDLAIVRFDRSMVDFVDTLSDHVPIVMRLIMRDEPVLVDPDDAEDEDLVIEIPDDADAMTVTFR